MNVLEYLDSFYNSFEGQKFIAGKSFFGKNVYCFSVSKSMRPVVIIQYAIHAREYITTYLAIEQIKDSFKHQKTGTVYFFPAVNPDGIEIALNQNVKYKANGRGVDLNVNFDAGWGKGEKNVFFSGAENYVGKCPFSEPETIMLKDFTLSVCPDATISYHSKGEEIYWEFFQKGKERKRAIEFAKTISAVTGYAIKRTPNSYGGYKDWCIKELKIPSLTIEVGRDNLSHPIGREFLDEIYLKNKTVVQNAISFLEQK